LADLGLIIPRVGGLRHLPRDWEEIVSGLVRVHVRVGEKRVT